jgi:hypothetical protein
VLVTALSEVDVKAVAAGLEHTVCITAKDIYAWGSNEYGQLGHGEHSQQVWARGSSGGLLDRRHGASGGRARQLWRRPRACRQQAAHGARVE